MEKTTEEKLNRLVRFNLIMGFLHFVITIGGQADLLLDEEQSIGPHDLSRLGGVLGRGPVRVRPV